MAKNPVDNLPNHNYTAAELAAFKLEWTRLGGDAINESTEPEKYNILKDRLFRIPPVGGNELHPEDTLFHGDRLDGQRSTSGGEGSTFEPTVYEGDTFNEGRTLPKPTRRN